MSFLNNRQLAREFFYALSSFWFTAIVLEIFWPRMITGYFNINCLMVLWIVASAWLLGTNKR